VFASFAGFLHSRARKGQQKESTVSLVDPDNADAAGPVSVKRARRSYATLRTVGALVLREMSTSYGRKPGGYLWAIIQPAGTILVLAFAFSLLQRSPALGTSFILFKATGLLIFQMFRTTEKTVSAALSYSSSLLVYPGVTWIDAITARFLLNGLVAIIVTLLILSGDILIEQLWLIYDWTMIVQAVFLTLILTLGVGVLNCYLEERFEIYSNFWNILTTPLMLASGIIVLYDDLPSFAQKVLWYNPLVHVVGMMRAGFYSTYHPQYISVTFVLLCGLVPLVLGLLLLRRHHRDLLTR